jgi:hypothetical protein
MCNSAQVSELIDRGIRGVFLYAARFDPAIAERFPRHRFPLKGLLGRSCDALPIDHDASRGYLDSIHAFSATPWNEAIRVKPDRSGFSWRDGESAFLLPDSLDREDTWIEGEAGGIERRFLSELPEGPADDHDGPSDPALSYPIHSLSAWVKEMKMYWYISKVERIEERLEELDPFRMGIWLQLINSDILSAVEKQAPVVEVRLRPGGDSHHYTIPRQSKEHAGEAWMHLLDNAEDRDVRMHFERSEEPHMRLLRGRLAYLDRLAGE